MVSKPIKYKIYFSNIIYIRNNSFPHNKIAYQKCIPLILNQILKCTVKRVVSIKNTLLKLKTLLKLRDNFFINAYIIYLQ